jgi:manganese transport protein
MLRGGFIPPREIPGLQFKLPTTATAPFCPSEVQGSVAVSQGAPFW